MLGLSNEIVSARDADFMVREEKIMAKKLGFGLMRLPLNNPNDDSDIDMLAVMETDRPWHNRLIRSDAVLRGSWSGGTLSRYSRGIRKKGDGHPFIDGIVPTGHIAYSVQSDQG